MAMLVGVFRSRVQDAGSQEVGGLLDPRGKPQVRDLFEIIGPLLERKGLHRELWVARLWGCLATTNGFPLTTWPEYWSRTGEP